MRPTRKRRIEMSDLAKARDEFFATEKGEELCRGNANGQYLRNRLLVAFYAGWDYCKKNHEAGKIIRKGKPCQEKS